MKIIAEIGVNHNGSLEIAKNLVSSAKECGADIVKFQTFKAKNNISSFVVIVYPNINCETKNIYREVKSFSLASGGLYLKKIGRKKFIEKIKEDRNDLQKIVEKKYSKITSLIGLINDQDGCIFSRMTGSGSACYGLFKSKKTARLAMIKLKRKYPKYWCDITKTI